MRATASMKTILERHRTDVRQQWLLLFVVCLTTTHLSAAPPEEPPSPANQIADSLIATTSAKYYPSDTLATARIGNLAEFRQGWKNSSLGAQAEDPALQKVFDSVLKRLNSITNETGIHIADIWQRVDREFSLALIRKRDGQFSVIAVAEFDDAATARNFVQQFEREMLSEAAELTAVQLASTELRSWRRKSRQNQTNLSFFTRANQVVFGEDLQTLAESARRAEDPRAANLGQDANYRHVMSRISGNATGLNWYVNPREMIRFAVTAEIGATSTAETLQQFIDAIGFGQLRGIGGSLWLGQGGMDSVSTTYGYLQTPLQGVLKALTLAAVSQSPPDWVKEDVSLYTQINFSVDRFVETLQEFVDQSRGPGAFHESIGSVQVTQDGVSLSDIARAINGPVHVAAQFPERIEDLLKQRTIVGFSISDHELIRRIMRQSAKNPKIATSQLGNAELLRLHLDLGDAFPEARDLASMELGIAVTDEAVLFSLNPDYLVEVLRGNSYLRPLATTAPYQEVARKFPAKTAMISFQRQDGRLEGLYEQLRTGNASHIPQIARTISGIDFESLPPFLKMFQYLQTSGSFIVPEEDGFRTVTITLPTSPSNSNPDR